MRLGIFSSVVLTALVALTGCGASGARAQHPVKGVSLESSVDTADWTPPGEMNFTMSESTSTRRPSAFASALPSPNRREATYGLVHAAY